MSAFVRTDYFFFLCTWTCWIHFFLACLVVCWLVRLAERYFIFLQEPSVKHEDRTLGWICCPSGQLYAKARIDRSAYCPGQEVKITGHVSNQSGKQVIGTEAQLVQKVVFKAPHGKWGQLTISCLLALFSLVLQFPKTLGEVRFAQNETGLVF